jgi:3-oxoacyl-[acyl-carrier protein] reductase
MAEGRLDGKWALITGAGRGFGQNIARRFAAEGARVVIHYNQSAGPAEALAEELGGFAVQADVTKWEDVKRLADEVTERTGGLDILVNNVGDVAPEQASWRELREDLVDRVIAVDVKGTLFMCHELGQRMLDSGRGGVIVNVCSNVVVTGSARAPQYAASKYGVLGVTKSYAAAFAPSVRVNALGPGFIAVESTLGRRDWTDERAQEIVDRTPLGRIADPDDLTGIVVFLASDDSVHMTGGFVLCDGGFSMVGA